MKTIITFICLVLLMAVPAQAGFSIYETTVGDYTGGDVGDGLDLDGTFYCAIDAGSTTGGTIRDAVFIQDPVSNLFEGGGNAQDPVNHPAGEDLVPDFGSSANDSMLETISNSRIMASSSTTAVAGTMQELTGDTWYKLQIGMQVGANYSIDLCWDVYFVDAGSGGSAYLVADNVQIGQSDTYGKVVTCIFRTDPDQTYLRAYVGLGNSVVGDYAPPFGLDGRYPSFNFMTLEEIDPISTTPCEENIIMKGLALSMDLNKDCYINLADFAFFAAKWLECNHPDDSGCL